MKKLAIVLFLLLSYFITDAQSKPSDLIVFNGKATTFSEYPGLEFRISEPYLRYQKWDMEHTGQAWFSVALEIVNKSKNSISALAFNVSLFNKADKIAYQGIINAGPMTFEPKDGNVLKPGYTGVYDAFISKDKSFYEKYGKLEFSINEVKTASASLNEELEFTGNWLSFEGFEGLDFMLSKPYIYLNDLSGNELFAIAIKFKNSSGKPVKFIYFDVKIYDDQGVLYENEIQENNQKYNPPPKNFMVENFPIDYEGIDKTFYIKDKSLFKNFKKIEIKLIKVE